MLPNKSKESVKRFIKSLTGYQDIQCFAIDMWKPYRTAVYELIPDAIVIVDKFHVIKEINNALDKIRKRVHEDDDERKFLKNTRYNLLHNCKKLTY